MILPSRVLRTTTLLTALATALATAGACATSRNSSEATAPTAGAPRSPADSARADSTRGYTLYHSGSLTDAQTTPKGGAYLAGGGTDIEPGMRWLLAQGGTQSNGAFGDVVVLRSSGSNGYHTMLTGMGAHSVRSFVIFSRDGAERPEIAEAIRRAEVVFIAGGDQSTYETAGGAPRCSVSSMRVSRQAIRWVAPAPDSRYSANTCTRRSTCLRRRSWYSRTLMMRR